MLIYLYEERGLIEVFLLIILESEMWFYKFLCIFEQSVCIGSMVYVRINNIYILNEYGVVVK